MRILALIPARAGSKRLPGKNVRPLAGKPLIVWSIEHARRLPEICATLVSTDDPAAADIARKAGAMVPWLRPPELASDTASSVDVALHSLDWYEQAHGTVDGLLLLQPTSPFREVEMTARGIAKFARSSHIPVVGFSPSPVHPEYCFMIEGERLRPVIPRASWSQIPTVPAYTVNGAFYLISPARLRADRSFLTDDTIPLIMSGLGARIDIDTELDWQLAELACRQQA
jgi:CMP-N-acetylneuraminic acid synthetase